MKYYIIAGERSGDLHGGNLIKSLKKYDTQADVRAWGGEQMQAAGAILVTHYAQMAFMGFWEVAKNYGTIRKFLKQCKADIVTYQPDVVILIDYAGFNMRIARFAKEQGYHTFYYISPKVWAWNQDRAYNIKRWIDRLFVIFPFEKDFFKKYDYEVDYVGNPLFDAISDFTPNPTFLAENGLLSDKPIIALLPGSRYQEVEQMLALMCSTYAQFSDYQYVIAGVSNLPLSLYTPFLHKNIKIVLDDSYNLLSVATAALVTSGTATLETALFQVPQVVCYKTGKVSYEIGKRLIRVPYISLVNLIAQNEVVKELIQDELTTSHLTAELKHILPNGSKRATQLQGYEAIKSILGDKGASDRTAQLMVNYLRS